MKSTSEKADAAAVSGAVSAVNVLQKSDVYSFAIILYEIYSRFTPAKQVSERAHKCSKYVFYRVVQLDFTPEIDVSYMLVDRGYFKNWK